MIRGGFAGRVLRVDLTRGETRAEPLDPDLARKFVGGLGLTVKLAFDAPVFNEFAVELPKPATDVLAGLAKNRIYGGIALSRWYPEMTNHLLVCTTEMNTKDEIDLLAEKLKAQL